jgi:hypothetical protein
VQRPHSEGIFIRVYPSERTQEIRHTDLFMSHKANKMVIECGGLVSLSFYLLRL